MESGRATLPALLSNCPCSTGLTVPALLSNCPCASVPELVRVRLRMRFGHIWPFFFFLRSWAHDVFGQGLGRF